MTSVGAIRRGERKQDPSSHLNTGTILSKGLTQGSEKKKKSDKRTHWPKTLEGFEIFQTTLWRTGEREGESSGSPRSWSLTVIISTLRDGSGGVKKGKKEERRERSQTRGAAAGGLWFPVHPLPLLSLSCYSLSIRTPPRAKEWEAEKTAPF